MNIFKNYKYIRYLLMYIKHLIKPLKYYGQFKEDLVVKMLLGKVDRFIDIGANNGITGSNTFSFALQGSAGLCFEPVYSTFCKLNWLFFLNKKIICINSAISDKKNTVNIRIDNALSVILETEDPINKECLKNFVDKDAQIKEILTYPLDFYLKQYPDFSNIDLLSIDVEGHELNVLQGIDFDAFNSRCIIIETLDGQSSNYEQISVLLKSAGYYPGLSNGLNTFWFNKNLLFKKEKIDQVIENFKEYKTIN